MLFAAEVRKGLDNVKPTKSGKREEQYLWRTYQDACSMHGYPGMFYEWEILVHRMGK